MPQRVLILGAAGRDFHNFNTYFRNNADYEVVAFTATQIPNIDGRRYPPELAGSRYPNGIPIEAEKDLTALIRDLNVDSVVFGYSDVSHETVMHLGSEALVAGADYLLLSPRKTMLKSSVPVVAVNAARTGAGKSQTSRRVAAILTEMGRRVVAVRHPMPYGDLAKQAVQRFETYEDLERHDVTIEEREEYEPHLDAGRVVFAGVDYERILRQAEQEADVVIWDGGNNDTSFFQPDLQIVVVDPYRADHSARYFPGEPNVRMADVIVVNKVDTANFDDVMKARRVAEERRCRSARGTSPPNGTGRQKSSTPDRTRKVRFSTRSKNTPRREPCCRPWVTENSKRTNSPRRFARRRPTSFSSRHRSTSAGSSSSTSPRFASDTSSRR
jgi:predicted GTPase